MSDTILAADPPVIDDTPAVTVPPASDPPVAADPPAADPPVADPPADTDWRTELAGEDEKLSKYLGKFPSLKDLAKAAKGNNDKLLQRAASKLPENPTDEEVAAYRKEHGIPEKPEGYLDTLPNGLVVGDDDRPAVDAFLAEMHAISAPKPAVDAALSAYYKIVDDQIAAETERISTAKEEGVQALRDEWGADYKRNLNAVDAYLSTLPVEVSEALTGAVDGNGLPLANSPAMIQWLASIALEANPLNTVVPGAGANQASAVADEIATWENKMRDPNSDYWKGATAEKNQARLRSLYEARAKIK